MSKRFSLYLGDELVEWLDEKAGNEKRSRNNLIEKLLSDVKEGRLMPSEKTLEETIIKNTRQPPSART